MIGIQLILPAEYHSANAAPNPQENCNYELFWTQQNTDSFAVVYPLEYVNLAQLVVTVARDELDKAYSNYSTAFGVPLEPPITIRVYPSLEDYYCLNALVPRLGGGAVHAHVGSSEIALFGNEINANLDTWRPAATNSLKYELAVLFAEKLTDGNAPQGLLYGIGGYAENPEQVFPGIFAAAGNLSSPTSSWQIVWQGGYDANNPEMKLQAASTVAYLVGVYGWDSFIEFLTQLANSGEYRQALVGVYGLGVQETQAQWRTYFQAYIKDDWRSNVFYSVDLSTDETLIAAGAYHEADARLESVLPMIEIFGSEEELRQAESMRDQARIGLEAGVLASQAREAILQGRYGESIGLANQAIEKFKQIGNASRIPELEAYAQIGREVVSLRAEVEVLEEGNNPFNPTISRRLWEIAQRLSVLGDTEGLTKVSVAFNLVSGGQRLMLDLIALVGVLVCVILIGRRVIVHGQPKPPEAELL